jgi:hypothetical protein
MIAVNIQVLQKILCENSHPHRLPRDAHENSNGPCSKNNPAVKEGKPGRGKRDIAALFHKGLKIIRP